MSAKGFSFARIGLKSRTVPLSQRSHGASFKALTSRTSDGSLKTLPPDTDKLALPGESRCPVLRAAQALPVPKNPVYPWTLIQGVLDLIFKDAAETTKSQLQGRPLVQHQLLGSPTYVVGSPDMAREVTKDPERFVAFWPPAVSGLLGSNSIVLMSGEAHRRVRSLLLPFFKQSTVAQYAPQLQQLLEGLLNDMADAAAAGPQPLGAVLHKYTFESMSRIVMGFHLEPQLHEQLMQKMDIFSSGLLLPKVDLPFFPFHNSMKARKQIDVLVSQRIKETKEALDAGEQPPGLLTQLLLAQDENGTRLKDEQLLDNFVTTLFAGNDTTSSTLNVLMYELLKQPELMQDLIQEQQQVEAKYGPQLTKEALLDMPFAECCITEALRLKHPVGVAFRKVQDEGTELGGYALEGGTVMGVPVAYLTNQDPTWLNETGPLALDKFNPRRYNGEQERTLQVAFGIGPHACLGKGLALLECKVFLAVLARKFTVRLAEDTTLLGPIPRAVNGLLCFIERA